MTDLGAMRAKFDCGKEEARFTGERMRPSPFPQSTANLDLAQLATKDGGVVFNLTAWGYIHDVQQVVLVSRVFITLHNQYVLEALVVRGTVLGRAVAHAVEFHALEGRNHACGVKGARALCRFSIQKRLHVARVSSLGWRETVLFTKGTDEGGRSVVSRLQLPVPVCGGLDL